MNLIEWIRVWGLGFIGVYMVLYEPLCPWFSPPSTPYFIGVHITGLRPLRVIPAHSSPLIHGELSHLKEHRVEVRVPEDREERREAKGCCSLQGQSSRTTQEQVVQEEAERLPVR